MEHVHAVLERETTSAASAETVPELVIHDVLNGSVTFEEYHSSRDV